MLARFVTARPLTLFRPLTASDLHRLEFGISPVFQVQDDSKADVRFDRVIELHPLVVEILENFGLSFSEGKAILMVPAIASMTCANAKKVSKCPSA